MSEPDLLRAMPVLSHDLSELPRCFIFGGSRLVNIIASERRMESDMLFQDARGLCLGDQPRKSLNCRTMHMVSDECHHGCMMEFQ